MAALENTDVNMTDPLQPNHTVVQTGNYINNIENSKKDYLDFAIYYRLIVPIIYGCIVSLGLLGNTMVIVIVLTNKTMRRISNIPVLNLAVTDLGFILLCVPATAIYSNMNKWPFGYVWCKLYMYSSYVSAYASVYTLVIMSVDRYLAIVHPIASIPFRKKANIMGILAIMWIIIFLGNIPIFFYSEVLSYIYATESESQCTITLFYKDKHAKTFAIVFFIFGYALPLLLVGVLYGLLVRRLLSGASKAIASMTSHIRDRQRRSVRIVTSVVVAFAVCWLPIHVINLIKYFGHARVNDTIFFLLEVMAECFACMNSCLNPIFYVFVSKQFRDAFKNSPRCSFRTCSKERS